MKFRRIYWVTEQFDEAGFSEVTGVYTSIPDLIETGLGKRPFSKMQAGFRITLCALDSAQPPLVSFSSPDFSAVRQTLAAMVEGGELTSDEVVRLSVALSALSRASP